MHLSEQNATGSDSSRQADAERPEDVSIFGLAMPDGSIRVFHLDADRATEIVPPMTSSLLESFAHPNWMEIRPCVTR